MVAPTAIAAVVAPLVAAAVAAILLASAAAGSSAVGSSAVGSSAVGSSTVGVGAAGALELGAELYRRDCAFCHGPQGDGTFRGPSLQGSGPAGVAYAIATGRMPIDDPHQRVRRGEPAYDAAEQRAIVAHAATFLDGPVVPAIRPDADVARGGVLYRSYCSACHGATGAGGALAYDDIAPAVTASSDDVVAAAVIVGPGTMPSLGEALPDDDLDAVVAYVAMLRSPPSPGGVAVPGGRVGEGLVALLLTVVVLGSAAWWIGDRR
ncbi:MAG: c-type cytochrome [Vicinamibacterales bacterium]